MLMVLVQPSYLLEPFLSISWLGIAKTKKKRINRIKFKLQAQIFHVGIFIFLIFFSHSFFFTTCLFSTFKVRQVRYSCKNLRSSWKNPQHHVRG